MRSRFLSIGVWLLVSTVTVAGAAEPKRPTAEQGGLFSLFTRGAEEKDLGADDAVEAEETEDAGAPADVVSPAEDKSSAPPVAEQVAPPEPAEAPAKAEAETPETAEKEAPATTTAEPPATAPEAEPPVAADEPPAAPSEEKAEVPSPAEEPPAPPSVAAPAEPPSPPVADGPAWPDAPDSGGIAEQPSPASEETPAASVAAIEEPDPPSEPAREGPLETPSETQDERAARAREAKPEIAAREIPSGGSVAPGAVALPETEIQGELEKPDIFFLLPKARDQSDDQVIRARIRREITQPLVKEWLEEMMLLK